MSGTDALLLPIGRSFGAGCLRSLSECDVPGMLEWMHDPSVAGNFQVDFASMTEGDALGFVRASWEDGESAHLAIDEGEGYLGTVSLKHIDLRNGAAEYAISTRSRAHGTGAAMRATADVLSLAFGPLGLNRVYLNVRADNARARAFYGKVGFIEEGVAREALRDGSGGRMDLVWLSMLAPEFRGRSGPGFGDRGPATAGVVAAVGRAVGAKRPSQVCEITGRDTKGLHL